MRAPDSRLALRALLTAILRRRIAAEDLLPFDPALVCALAEEEGVVALVRDALRDAADIPEPWLAIFDTRARHLAALDVVREPGLREVITALERVNAGALVMKGTALAYSHYARPDLRPRLDCDLLVPRWARDRSRAAVESLGFRAIEQQEGDLLMYQTCYERQRGPVTETIDLHWRALNPHVFAGVLGYRDLAAESVTVPALGRGAHALSPVHALVLACSHLFAHHESTPRLIWIYDIHLLATSLRAADWQHFLMTIERDRVGAVCRSGLELAAETFGTTLPRGLLGDNRMSASDEPTAVYLHSHRHAAVVWADFQALKGWRARTRLAGQYLFPRADYMRKAYAPGSRLPLAMLYVIRISRGAWKWLTPPPAPSEVPLKSDRTISAR